MRRILNQASELGVYWLGCKEALINNSPDMQDASFRRSCRVAV